ncbi:MAG: YSC84-related protein [Gammaproteobacteria bacterium]|nr:YSC84-related protein [Gammaproteobacteria bacterium]
MKRNIGRNIKWVLVLVCALFATGTVAVAQTSKEEKREDVRKMAAQTLTKLYEAQPGAKSAIENAAGYAVFSNFGMKIFVAGGGKGRGIAINNSTGEETFMRMVEVQAGLGFGIKKFRLVFVFDNRTELNKFIESGWQLGGQGTAAAKAGGQGSAFAGAMSVSPGVWLYQLTDTGLALELTGKGTKYSRDKKLN